jgi:hypothetical protein
MSASSYFSFPVEDEVSLVFLFIGQPPFFFIKMIKGAFDISDSLRNKVKAYDGGFYRGVAKETTNGE